MGDRELRSVTWSPSNATELFDLLRDGVLVVAPDDTLAFVNASVLERLGAPADGVVGRSLYDVFPVLARSDFPSRLDGVRSGGGPWIFDGYVHPLRGWYQIDVHLDGDILVGFVRDVTEQRRLSAGRDLITAVGEAVGASTSWSGALHDLADLLRRHLGYDVAEVWSWSTRRGQLRLMSVVSDPDVEGLERFVEATRATQLDVTSLPGRAATSGEVLVTTDLADDPQFQRADAAADAGLRSAVHVRLPVDRATTVMVGLFRRGRVADGSDVVLARSLGPLGEALAKRRSGLELEQFFELSREFVAITNLSGRFRRVNPAMIEALGYPEEELLTLGYGTILHPDDLEPTAQAIDEMARTGQPVDQHENRVRTAAGDYRWVSWKAQLFDSEGIVFCTGRDVTDERRERIERDVQAEVLQAVVAGEPLPRSLESIIGLIEAQDPSVMCSILLHEPSSDPSRPGVVRVAAAPSLPAEFNAAVDGMSVGPSAGSCGTAMFRGEMVVVSDIATDPLWDGYRELAVPYGFASCWSIPILGTDDQVLGAFGMYSKEPSTPSEAQLAAVHDACRLAAVAIQRSRSDAAIVRSDERFRLLADVITDAAWDWDIAADTRWRNQGFWTLFGYEPMALDGSDTWWRAHVHPDDRDRLLASRQKALEGPGDSWVAEYRFRRADGEYSDVMIRSRIVRDDNGLPIRMVGGMTDLTERRSLERQYLRAQRVESLGTLASGIAHDLNNSLMPILMAVELLEHDDLDDESREHLEVISASAHRSADMVRRILGFARGLEGAAVSLSLNEVVRSSLRLIRDVFPKNIELAVDDTRFEGTIRGDLTQLHQVLLNLALNARDAMPDGGRLTITIDEVTLDDRSAAAIRLDPTGGMSEVSAGRYARVRVTDTGAGVPSAVRDRLFEPFFTTKMRTEGTGLGLATSLAIVRGHGGGIAVTSENGVGTTFAVHLPVELDPTQPIERPEVRGDPEPVAATASGSTVLVVDDEPAVRTVIREVLESAGYRVVGASSGAEALRLHQEEPDRIGLVLTDVMMPVMDGVQFVRRLREVAPSLPVVAMTGLDDPARAMSLADAGVLTVLSKPFDRASLLDTVAAALVSGS